MQLFGSLTSPFVRHVRIALTETQAPYTFIETDAKGSAEQSPTMKVPFLRDGDLELTDSMSILRYIREKAGQPFLPTVQGLDIFCLVNTLMDSAINLFLLERNRLDTSTNAYFDRQRARIIAGLKYLNKLNINPQTLDKDALIRLECFLAWGVFRQRFSLDGLHSLQLILDAANNSEVFAKTSPPESIQPPAPL